MDCEMSVFGQWNAYNEAEPSFPRVEGVCPNCKSEMEIVPSKLNYFRTTKGIIAVALNPDHAFEFKFYKPASDRVKHCPKTVCCTQCAYSEHYDDVDDRMEEVDMGYLESLKLQPRKAAKYISSIFRGH